jgi:hypothetical protein
MTVCTTNDTFRHLPFDLISAAGSSHERANFPILLTDYVVEFKHNDVAFTAINTRVHFEESPHELAVCLVLSTPALVPATIMFLPITMVVCFAVCPLTFSAIGNGMKRFD